MEKLLSLTSKIEQFAALLKNHGCELNLKHRDDIEFKTRQDWEKEIQRENDKNRLLRIGFIGRVKAGKSSLLNALLFNGKDVLPKAATPMTAALTSIKYGNKLQAKVIFYTPEDIQQIEKSAQEYEQDRIKVEQSKRIELQEKQKNSRKQLSAEEFEARIERAVKSAMQENKNAACYDQYQRIKASGFNPKNNAEDIFADSTETLMGKLYDYVGAKGKYMPLTREVELYLPEENLKDIEIVDTPGVNDPIKSREERTAEFLKHCDAVFLISPTESFLSEQDVSFLGRITKGSGILRASIVASKADDDLFGSLADSATNPIEAFNTLAKQLTEKAHDSLNSNANNTIAEEVIELFKKHQIICTSSMAYNLWKQFDDKANWDEGMQTVWGNFQHFYKTAFSSDDISKQNLEAISNIPRVKTVLDETRAEKGQILEQKRQAQIPIAKNNLEKLLDEAMKKLDERCELLAKESEESIKQKKQAIDSQKVEIEKAARIGLTKNLDDLEDNAQDSLESMVYDLTRDFNDNANKAKSVKEDKEYYTTWERREKSGFWSWAARKTGLGGYEDVQVEKSRTIYRDIVNANNVLAEMQAVRSQIQQALNNEIKWLSRKWKNQIQADIFQTLRVEFDSSKRPDDSFIKIAVENVLSEMPIFNLELDAIPAHLNKNSQLQDSEARNYLNEAKDYVEGLSTSTLRNISAYLNRTFTEFRNYPIGSELTKSLDKETSEIQQMLQNKEANLTKLNGLKQEVEQLKREVNTL